MADMIARGMINNIKASTTNIINMVEKYKIDNTGIEYVSERITQILATLPHGSIVYFPSGIYLCNSTIILSKHVTIIGDATPPDFSGNEPTKNWGTVFKNTIANTTVISTNDLVRVYLKDFYVDGNSCDFVDNFGPVLRSDTITDLQTYTETLANVNGIDVKRYYSVIENVHVRNCSGLAFNLGSFNFMTKCTVMQCNKAINLQFDNSVHQFRAQWVNYGFYFENTNGASTNTIIDCRIDETTHNGIYVSSGSTLYGTQFYGINIDLSGEAGIRIDGEVSGCIFNGVVGRTGCYYRNKTVAQMASLSEEERRKACNVCIVGKTTGTIYNLSISYNNYDGHTFPSYVMYLGTGAELLSSEFYFTGTFNNDGIVATSLNPSLIRKVVNHDTTASIPLTGTTFRINGLRFGSINNYAVYLYTNPWIENTFYAGTLDPTTVPVIRNVPLAVYNNEMYVGHVGGNYKKITVT